MAECGDKAHYCVEGIKKECPAGHYTTTEGFIGYNWHKRDGYSREHTAPAHALLVVNCPPVLACGLVSVVRHSTNILH